MKSLPSKLRLRSQLLFFTSVIVLFESFSLPLSASLQTKPAAKIDLNGTWKDGRHKVTITQIGSSVVAKYIHPPLCDPRDGSQPKPRETDFVGTINGNTIDGYASVCNWGKEWGAKIGIQTVKMVLTISADQNTLDGTYDGHKGKQRMTLTRDCDDGELCASVGRAIAAMKGTISASPSVALYSRIKSEVGLELSQIKNNLCDNPEKAREVEALQRDLESLSYTQGQSNAQNNIVLARIETSVKQFGVDLCGRSSTEIPPPVSCPQGNTAKTDADAAMFDTFRTALEQNLTTIIAGPGTILRQSRTKRCLGEMFGQYCSPNGFIENLRVARDAWAEGPPSTEVCKKACQALGAWYSASACSKDGLQEAAVVDRCTLTCKTSELTQ